VDRRAVKEAPRAAHVQSECVVADAALTRAFNLLGHRWTGVVLATLSSGPVGFRDLARAVTGISDSMLSARLSSLTDAGLVARVVDEGPPLGVTYELTERGHALIPALKAISQWAGEHLPAED
jgi:DNA-binding HxlR family transcriptional regulator